MKKILLTIFAMVLSEFIFSQIQLVYTSPQTNVSNFGVVHLYYAGNKFFERDDSLNTLTLYNSDFTVYKIINLPNLPFKDKWSHYIHYLTENLFDNDSTTLEYLLYYKDSFNIYNVRIYGETGNLLFQRDSASSYPLFGNTSGGESPSDLDIDYVDSAFYLRIWTNAGTEIYRLPGVIPCYDPCSNKEFRINSGIQAVNNPAYSFLSDPVPNPGNLESEILFTLPSKITNGFIDFYDLYGNKIKSIRVNNSQNKIIISNSEFASGVYNYSLTWEGCDIRLSKKLVVVR